MEVGQLTAQGETRETLRVKTQERFTPVACGMPVTHPAGSVTGSGGSGAGATLGATQSCCKGRGGVRGDRARRRRNVLE